MSAAAVTSPRASAAGTRRWTGAAVSELCGRPPRPPFCCLTAEIGAALRVAGPPPQFGRPVEASLGSWQAAARLRAAIAGATSCQAHLTVDPAVPGSQRRYLLWIPRGRGADLVIRQARLVGPAGQPLVGMPSTVAAGRRCDCAAAWRGAFLATGVLDDPLRPRAGLTVTCPTLESAFALCAAARRSGIDGTRVRQSRGAWQVTVQDTSRDGGPVVALLVQIGCPDTAGKWLAERQDAGSPAGDPGETPEELGRANVGRAARAAALAAAQAKRALEILGEHAPDHLAAAARLRIEHPDLPLLQLGEMADPPLSKDTIAGRLRRLNSRADARAADLGIPGASAVQVPAAS